MCVAEILNFDCSLSCHESTLLAMKLIGNGKLLFHWSIVKHVFKFLAQNRGHLII